MASHAGRLAKWFRDRNFGFINELVVGANGRTTLVSRFTHIAYIAERVPVEGCFVRFETAPSTQGRPDRAINVEYYETEAAPDPAPTVDVLSGKDDATC